MSQNRNCLILEEELTTLELLESTGFTKEQYKEIYGALYNTQYFENFENIVRLFGNHILTWIGDYERYFLKPASFSQRRVIVPINIDIFLRRVSGIGTSEYPWNIKYSPLIIESVLKARQSGITYKTDWLIKSFQLTEDQWNYLESYECSRLVI